MKAENNPSFRKSSAHPPLSRRRVLQVGAIGALGLGLPDVLMTKSAAANSRGSDKSCIFICQYGGLSQLDSWDPKPLAPEELRGPYKPIATASPGFHVGELMPQLARLSEKYCVIRSMSHGVPIHDVANRMLLAGHSQPAMDAPAFGSIVTKLRPATANVPPYVWLQKFGGGASPPEPTYLTGGFLGPAHSPLVLGKEHADNPATDGYRIKAFESAKDISVERLGERRRLLGAMVSSQEGTINDSAGCRTLKKFQDKAHEILAGNEARAAFDIDQEPAAVRDRYGRHPFGQNLLLARRLIEAGVRLVNVVAWMGLAANEKFVSVETWDMHGNAGVDIFGNGWNGLGFALPRCDAAVATLLEDLEQRGLLESTLVVLVGEFGRTPRVSKGASAIGRDHWPNCYSAMLAGGGIRGGQVYGASDARAAYVRDRPVTPEDFGATLFHALGIAPETRLSPDGFTKPASQGTPILELF